MKTMREGTFRVAALLLFVSLIYYGYGLAKNDLNLETEVTPPVVSTPVDPADAETETTGITVTPETNTEPIPIASLLPGSGSDFFIDYKLERERTRSYQAELLNGLVDNPRLDEVTRKEAAQQLLLSASTVRHELEIEGLIKAKGFADSLVLLNKDSVVVVVRAPAISEVEVARILDIVTRSTGLKADKIIVLPKS